MGEEGQVIACHTLDSWNQQLQKGKDSNKIIVVDFTATWCGPCKFMAPIFEELASKNPNGIFLKVDVDKLQSVASDWNVNAMPTFLFLKDGEPVGRLVGANAPELQRKVEQHIAAA
ncbi:Thioredoxin h1 [Thalictrum thalictroides]|uniref:Thioredoxin h1 n=1 Tax=Thalictrum thalictroides TaxID=46969 RepID=A0A7J6W8U2_THATH|nr:Thioredoxin h1 [Thalictrum thalictroides]